MNEETKIEIRKDRKTKIQKYEQDSEDIKTISNEVIRSKGGGWGYGGGGNFRGRSFVLVY